ncbi:MAG: BamA/TamA family outer membrane protein [Bacteroidia bacterium]|nr:BamA/TamA family outer membrane protein [Bacteroidia bacterium]
MYIKIKIFFFFLLLSFSVSAQVIPIGGDTTGVIDLTVSKEYEIGGIEVKGAEHFDKNVIVLLTGLGIGDKVQVPGDKFATAIENLWKQGLFDDIKITADRVQGKYIFIDITVVERPRLLKFALKGITKSEADELRERIKLVKGKVITDNVLASTKETVKEFFVVKGYTDVAVDIRLDKEPKQDNVVIMFINIDKKKKVRIKEINIIGNKSIGTFKLRRKFKETKRRRWWNPFNDGKFDEDNYEKDKNTIVEKYNQKGFRDAAIVKDSIYREWTPKRFRPAKHAKATVAYFLKGKPMLAETYFTPKKRKTSKLLVWESIKRFQAVRDTNYYKKFITIDIYVSEGKKYYFRDITWVGNSKYSSKDLSNVLGIKKGEVFNQEDLDAKLFMNPNGSDISSLYMDEGYLFFNVTPVETMVNGDSIDIEMRIYEGKQATINKITIVGNTKTNDRVVMREIRTRPGQLFRRSDVIRSQRELSQLGYFDPEKMNVVPTPNPATGTVDIEYTVEEKPSDQIELSGGYGGGRVVGTLGVSFNNFSAKNFFKKDAWRPLPSGDGQRLSVRAQSNGLFFQSYNISFTEPWLGGRKPNSLSVTAYYSIQSNGEKKRTTNSEGVKVLNPARASLDITGLSIGLGRRLKWPDDYFTLYQELNYQYYVLNNYGSIFSFSKGYANNIYYKATLQRNSVDKPIFETRGSVVTLSGQWTPPYSLFNGKDYSSPTMTDQERFNFVEYQKYKATVTFFTPITNKRGEEGKEARNLILRTTVGMGFLTSYNSKVGQSPFERFYLGGSGLTGFALDGREIIALRGYDDQSLSAARGSMFITKYTAELRFPVTTNPQATIYMLAFTEGGNTWQKSKEFNPFKVYRSAGLGVRVFLPMFGLLGFDYGWRLDDVPTNPTMQKGQFHFTIGASIGEL